MGLVAQDTQYRHLRRRSIHLLKKLCETHGIYPSSFIVPRREIRKTPGTLTHGGSADVWEGRYKESSVALKEFRASTKAQFHVRQQSFCREVAIWKYLDHPNITKCYGVSSQKSPLCLVSKWMVNGTLDAYLKVKRGINRLELIRDIVAGLCYLHEMGLVHGDLKCLNILVDENGIACLADFGLALFAHNEHTNFIAKTTIKGSTTRWAAPEILHTDASSIHPTMESDVYSFAWVMWEVFTGHIPFFEIQSAAGVITRVLDKKRPQRPLQATGIGLSDEVWDIMEQCWRHEPDARPPMTSVQECLEHILKEQDPAVLKMPTVWPLVIEPSSTPDPKSPS
ncbi:kinase-like protein [Obba rivulosa]|uniref:Kinase-like protein n=1 Tax=Obba rivulosa TaxID=1052685 RepID=A0A8E2APR2_9APHY|nr:kinase-like protein [Obba rivulosa]